MEPAAQKRKWPRRSLIVVGALVLFVLAVLASGYPQKWAVESAIRRNFGMIAKVEWGGTVPDLRIKHVYLYANSDQYKRRAPVLSATEVRVSYSPFANDRKISKVSIGDLSIDADLDTDLFPKPAESTAPGTKAGAKASTTFLPREVSVQELAVHAHRADGTSILAEAGGLRVELSAADAMTVSLRHTGGRIVADFGEAHVRLNNVAMNGTGTYTSGTLSWQQHAEAPGVFALTAKADGPLAGNDAHIEFKIDEAALKGDGLEEFLKSAGSPLRFDEFNVESAAGRVDIHDSTAFTMSAAARMYSIGLQGAAEPLYGDTVRVLLTATGAERLDAEATAVLAQGQSVRLAIKGNVNDGTATAKVAGWSRAQLASALPLAFRESVEGLGFDAFSSDAALKWTKLGYQVDAHAESKGGGPGAAPIAWTVQALGARDGSQAIQGTAEARIGDRGVRASAKYEDADHYVAEATIEEVKLAPWVELFAGKEIASSFGGTIEGAIHAEAKSKGAPLEIRPDVKLKKFVYDTLALDEITTKGTVRYAQAGGRITVDELRAEAPDGMTAVVLKDWDYDINKRAGGGAIALEADLAIVAKVTGLTELNGTGGAEAKVRIDGSKINADLSARSSDLRVGEVWLPTSAKLNVGGTFSYDSHERRGALSGWKATLGEGTTLRLADAAFTTSPLRAETELVSESDLQVLVGMNWLASAQGSLRERSKIRIADDVVHVDWEIKIDAPAMALTGNAGTAEAVAFEAAGSYDDGLKGTGQIRAAKLMAGGGSVLNASGPVLFDGEMMRIQQAKGEIFRGSIGADIDIGVLQSTLPIKLSGRFEDADLAIFSDEVKPPNTQLTGKARGTLEVDYGVKGLTGFAFEAEAPGGLSVNRSLVEKMLQTDKFLSGAGANVAGKAMDKLLGTAAQRPFDRGRLNANLADDKITGLAVLESQQTKDYHGLNLRVTLDMDLGSLEQALQMLQESSGVDISAGRPAQ